MFRDHREEVARVARIVADDTILLLEAPKAETGNTKPTDLRVLDKINQLWDHSILHVCGYEHYKNDFGYYAQYLTD